MTSPHLLLALLPLLVLSANAQDALPKTAETFEIAGHKAFLYAAPNPAAVKPWL